MLDKLIKELFTMRMMALGLLIFLVAIAKATFIESDFGTPASKIAIYNTRWFEILLIYLSIGLIINIAKYRMFRPEKAASLAFHLSFLIIIIGAGVTRYVGFEGQMPLKEGQQSNVIFSADPYLRIKANDLAHQFEYEEQRWLSEGRENPFSIEFELPDQPKINIDYVSYKENLLDTIIEADSLDGKALEFVIRGETVRLFENTEKQIGGVSVSFNMPEAPEGLRIFEKEDQLYAAADVEFQMVDMMKLSVEDRQKNRLDSSAVTQFPEDTTVAFNPGKLYMVGSESMMFRMLKTNIQKTRMKAKQRDEGVHYLTVRLAGTNDTTFVELAANHDRIIDPAYVNFMGLNFEIGYGAKPIELPFEVRCNDFQLDRYPGSTMPSSFASEVSLIDKENNVEFDQRIFMNNVMDYQGYRFFQSSYYPDESGTVLSVNYDWWGTNITYLGYLLMAIGMFLSVLAPKGRFLNLNKSIQKSRSKRAKMLQSIILLICLTGYGLNVQAHEHKDHDHNHDTTKHSHDHDHDHEHEHDHDHDHSHDQVTEAPDADKFKKHSEVFNYITKEQAEDIGYLLVQDYQGRILPFHTLSDQVIRKVHYADNYNGKTPVQVMMAFHLYGPAYWMEKELVYISSKIRDDIGLGKYATMNELENEHGEFLWMEDYQEAFEKPDSKKSEYDKQLIKLGERYVIMKDIFSFKYFRVVPVPGDHNGTWVWPFSIDLRGLDQTGNEYASEFLRKMYATTQGNIDYASAKKPLNDLIEYQWEMVEIHRANNPSAELPTRSQIKAEVVYNKLNVFKRAQNIYLLVGLLLLILFFIRILMEPNLQRDKMFKRISYPFIAIIVVMFIVHGIGLGYLWYITGRAPWSNGYEAIIFIAWATVIAGLLFVKKNPAVLAATAILAGLILFVTELNLLDPEITPLQPVLKSYWLMIHVAIITASYGFLGLAAILAIVNLTLYLAKTQKNKKRLSMNINELTAVSEMTMTVGLFMLTIGTFLGGVWANESWGRYWGWDPKETWALVSVLTYAIILHLRFIPKMKDRFIFNFFSLWGFSAILFTFFGVNFMLVGLHSYAQGEGMAELPLWVSVTIGIFAIFTISAGVKHYTSKK